MPEIKQSYYLQQALNLTDADTVQSLGEQYSQTENALEAAMEEWSELAEHME